jgi:2-deoxy-D-gluconate 3-dehydrogenase
LYETKEIAERLTGQIPLGYLGELEDVLGAALYLGSSLSDYVNGAVLTVDGGATAAGGIG